MRARFYIAVTSSGIFCRLDCLARRHDRNDADKK
ncbi:Ada metal-binding domain-containing protein [Paraburkholderia sp. GAS41]